MSRVLLVGQDEMLLQTRAAVVRTTGVETLCCDASAALRIQAERQCDVVILCHSLPPTLSTSVAEVIRARWPKTRILLVSSTRMWEQFDSGEVADAATSTDPERLVLRTIELLGRRGPTMVKFDDRCIPRQENSIGC